MDDTGLPRKGKHLLGIARQCCGQLGKQGNGQVAVSLSLASETASLRLDKKAALFTAKPSPCAAPAAPRPRTRGSSQARRWCASSGAAWVEMRTRARARRARFRSWFCRAPCRGSAPGHTGRRSVPVAGLAGKLLRYALNYDDIRRLCEKAKSADLVFQTGHQYHSSRLYRHIVELVRQRKVGELTAIECQWNRNGNWRRPVPDPKWERLINWRMYREYSGGLVAELCSHQIDFANWLLNSRPSKVSGFGGIDYWKDGRETYDNVHLITEYPSGVKARYTSLTTNSKDGYQIKILGTEGSIIINKNQAWLFAEALAEKGTAIVDGVSGATRGAWGPPGVPISLAHNDLSLQALMDFGDAIANRLQPQSDIKSGADVAVVVQMTLNAMDKDHVEHWKDQYNYIA